MSTRAEKYTQLQKIPDLFSDFTTCLNPHPITKDLIRLREEQSIKQSIKNLVLTVTGERPFNARIGSTVNRSLFEFNDDFTSQSIVSSITESITTNEPRVALIDVIATPRPDDYSYDVRILYTIINTRIPQSIDLVLRRVR